MCPKRECITNQNEAPNPNVIPAEYYHPAPPFPFVPSIWLTLVLYQPQPCFYISQGVYTANELFAGRPKVYLISQLLWREQEQTWWYLLKDGVNPDGPLTGWVAEAAMKAVESEGMVLC